MKQKGKRLAVAMGALLPALCLAGARLRAAAKGSQEATHYATTVRSPGPINPAAISLGDGYVSSKPKVSYQRLTPNQHRSRRLSWAHRSRQVGGN